MLDSDRTRYCSLGRSDRIGCRCRSSSRIDLWILGGRMKVEGLVDASCAPRVQFFPIQLLSDANKTGIEPESK